MPNKPLFVPQSGSPATPSGAVFLWRLSTPEPSFFVVASCSCFVLCAWCSCFVLRASCFLLRAYRVFWSPPAKHEARSMSMVTLPRRSRSQRNSCLFVPHGQAQSMSMKQAICDQKMWFWAQSTKHEHKAQSMSTKQRQKNWAQHVHGQGTAPATTKKKIWAPNYRINRFKM
jgi:hypothetical protein